MDMDGAASAPPPPPPPTSQSQLLLFRRRNNSIPTGVVTPINLTTLHQHHHPSSSLSTTSSSSPSSGDFELISIKPTSYTSLRELLPSTAVNSPKPNSPAPTTGSDISIKNRLVKQAAWAYLQPMSTSPDSSARNFLHRFWDKLETLKNPVAAAFRGFFDRRIFRKLIDAFDWLLRAIGVRTSFS